jgi:MFS family permease
VRFLRAFLVAIFTALVACILAFFVGDYLTRLGHMSNMEGGRGMFVVFVCAPLGILVGFVTGIVSSLLVWRQGAAGFFIAQGWSLLIVCAVAGLLVGVSYLLSEKPPRIGGKELSLEFELRVPPQFSIPDTLSGDRVRVSLYSGKRETTYAFIDWASIKRVPEGAIIPGRVHLLDHNPARSLFAVVGNDPMAGQFVTLKLPSNPRPEDEQWSDWIDASQQANLGPIPEAARFSARYRVQPAEP